MVAGARPGRLAAPPPLHARRHLGRESAKVDREAPVDPAGCKVVAVHLLDVHAAAAPACVRDRVRVRAPGPRLVGERLAVR
eukprot:7387942-Prymnesium_polylepis.1